MIGLVVRVYGLFYTVSFDGRAVNCTLRGKIRQAREGEKRYTNPIAVGDRVICSLNPDGTGSIDDVCERANVFSRKDKGRNRREDIIATNLDQIIVIQSFIKPRLNLRFVDRILVRAHKEKIPALLCVNKSDLADRKAVKYVKEYYAGTGIQTLFTSALKGTNMGAFKKSVEGRMSILVGNSGAGKTSMLNRLYPGLNLRISEVSESTGKGRHTTTNVQMIEIDDSTRIIDTPGLREFGLMDIEPHMLEKYFPEFHACSGRCAYQPCSHDHEPNCEIKKMVEAGTLNEDRYISYLNILYSIREYQDGMYS
jgi:ribosome biogenesis GTPase